jgi:hypothetical protein
MKERFSYLTSIKGLVGILLSEALLLWLASKIDFSVTLMILLIAVAGMVSILILSKEVIYEYSDHVTVLIMFLATIVQFIIFFAFQYWFLLVYSQDSFSGFAMLPVDFLLHSTLIFLFNPMVIPNTETARALMLSNLFGSVIIIIFILQNIWHFKSGKHNK